MIDVLWSVGGFVLAIGVLVAFHEFGHFWVARRCGVKVLRFSIGFGRVIWRRQDRDGVEWALSAIPLGSYVKMLDSREAEVPEALRSQAFDQQPVGRRALIVAAGPAFNFILAIVFYWLIFVVGVQGMKPLLAAPAEGSVAAQAGLREGEQVLAVEGRATPTWQVLHTRMIDRALDRGDVRLEVQGLAGGVREVVLDLRRVRVDPEFLFTDLGMRPFDPPIPPVLDQVIAGEAAAEAGFVSGDRLLSADGEPVDSWQDWARWVRERPGAVIAVEFERDGERLRKDLIVGSVDGRGRFGASVAIPPDLWQDLRAEHREGVVAAMGSAVAQTWQMSALTLKMMWRMVQGEVSVKNVSGPVQIAQVAGLSAQVGLVSFLSFMAVVSISLGVLNLLPVPMLDGGHLLYFVIEAVKGSPVSEQVMEAGARIGLLMLAGLMSLAFYNDIVRLIP
jgi:regulator of sigma E protease